MSENVAAIAVREPQAIVRPAAALDELAAAFQEYERVCAELLNENDYQRVGRERFRKRSGWRKLGVAFSIDYELVEKTIERDDEGRVLRAEFLYRAVAPNGRHVDGWGSCDLYERCCEPGCTKRGNHQHCPAAGEGGRKACGGRRHFSHADHDIPATAETRAKNRGAADLFGMGEVSAEELVDQRPGGGSTVDDREQTREQQKKLFAVLGELDKVQPLEGRKWKDHTDEWAAQQFDGKLISALNRGEMSTLIDKAQAHLDRVKGSGAGEQPDAQPDYEQETLDATGPTGDWDDIPY